MSRGRIEEDLPEIVEYAGRLMHNEIDYDKALADYFPRLLRAYDGDGSKIFSATEPVDRSDLASGVLYSTPGTTSYPVRLATELFQRALEHADADQVHVYDPLSETAT